MRVCMCVYFVKLPQNLFRFCYQHLIGGKEHKRSAAFNGMTLNSDNGQCKAKFEQKKQLEIELSCGNCLLNNITYT